MRKLTLQSFGLAALLSMGSLPAVATLQLQPGLVGGGQGVDNVIFNTCNLPGGPALTVQGCLNTDHTTLVDFTSNEDITIAGGGQAKIDPADGAFDNILIQLDDPTRGFSKLQFNLHALNDGTVNFLAIDQFGNPFNFSAPLDGNGDNKFTLFSNDNQVAASFKITSTVALQDITELEQVRLGPATVCAPNCGGGGDIDAPEPASVLLLGMGLLGLGAYRRWGS